MAPGHVVDVLDVVSNAGSELQVGSPMLSIKKLDLHRTPERLHRGVVEAVADSAHGADEAQASNVFGEGPRGELGEFN